MTWDSDAKADIRRDEALRTEAYEDVLVPGLWTIGYGHTGKDVVKGLTITAARAEQLLDSDFEIACTALDEHLPWWKIAPDPIRRGISNMCLNLGYPRLSGFAQMLACGEMGNYNGMADAALDSKWAKQVGARADRIADLFRSAAQGVAA